MRPIDDIQSSTEGMGGTGAPSGTVTFLFTDIEGSTRLWEEHPKAMSEALRRHDELMRRCIEDHEGHVVKTVGDAFHAAFTTTAQATAAAAGAQQLLGRENWPAPITVRVRMAIHSGQCEERDGDYFGPAVNRAARLAAIASGGQVLVSGTSADLLDDAPEDFVLLRDLGVHRLKDLGRPEHVFQLVAPGLDTDFPPLRSLDNPALLHNLPVSVSSFVGRETEAMEVQELVHASRMVTLTGAGGSGKTRLALQVAAESLDDFSDGVWLVELAPLADPAFVASTLASTLRVREEPGRPLLETLVNALSERHLLVVLDNCEHVLVASATLADTLLRSCPGLRVFATSREPLGVTGEHVYRVPSLSLPQPGQIILPEQAPSFDAVQLFIERAVAHDSTFHLGVDNAATVASLCRELDGMPLAIELAAARLAALSIEEIERRLADRFRLLTRGNTTVLPRHQTLRALIDWSYDLLDEQEQATLCRLSTFVGGWSLEAAEAIIPTSGPKPLDVMDVLGSLVDKSLVQIEPTSNGDRRYRQLETIRHYCAEKFSHLGPGERTSTHRAHAMFFLGLAEEAAPHLSGSERAQWFERIGLELGNLRVAMAHFASDPATIDRALRIWIALEDFWSWGYHGPGIEELEKVLPKARDEQIRGLRARALWAVARLRVEQGDYAIAQALFGEAFEVGKSIGDRALMAKALGGSGFVAMHQGNITTALNLTQQAVELAIASGNQAVIAYQLNNRGQSKSACGDSTDRLDFEDSLARFREVDDRFGIGSVLQNLTIRELKDGNLGAARDRVNEALDLSQELPDPSYGALVLLGLVELLDGNASAPSRVYRDLLAVARRKGFKTAIGLALLGMGFCATMSNDPHRAARLHGAADSLFETIG
jgi:predicted ATPase/class 3 adenylate cyclase